ncbi:TPA: BrnA antitoxin family protein, partial [Escherichia coli]
MTKRKASTPPLTDEEEARIQVGIAQDPDNPEITAEQFGEMRPASEVLPQGLFQALTKRGRPPAENKAVQVTLRVPPAVLDGYKA